MERFCAEGFGFLFNNTSLCYLLQITYVKVWCSWGFSSDFVGKNGSGDDEECAGGRVRERSVCMCVVFMKKIKKGEEEWEWQAKERKGGVDCVMGSRVRLGARGSQQSDLFFFFFLTDRMLQSLQNTLFGKIWLFSFFLTLLCIYTIIPTIQWEL